MGTSQPAPSRDLASPARPARPARPRAAGRLLAALALAPALACALALALAPRNAAAQVLDSAASSTAPRIMPLPILFYQEETKWGFGAGLMRLHRASADSRTSTDQLLLLGTQRKQYSAALATERYTQGNRHHLRAQLSASRFPNSFFGVGNDTRAEDEEQYTPDVLGLQLEARRALRPSLYAGLSASYEHMSMHEAEADGRLVSGEIPGGDGGTVAGLGLTLALDRREHVVAPRGGEYVSVQAAAYAGWLGSDYRFTRLEADARAYRRAGPAVIAAQAAIMEHGGEVPFHRLATLGGGSLLRGSFEGRYRDRARAVLQSELRLPVWRRFAAVAFAGAGQVAPGLDRLRADAFHVGAGGGLRFILVRSERAAVRIDYAVSGRESGVYFAFGEAF